MILQTICNIMQFYIILHIVLYSGGSRMETDVKLINIQVNKLNSGCLQEVNINFKRDFLVFEFLFWFLSFRCHSISLIPRYRIL